MYACMCMYMDMMANIRFQLTNNTTSYGIKRVSNIFTKYTKCIYDLLSVHIMFIFEALLVSCINSVVHHYVHLPPYS